MAPLRSRIFPNLIEESPGRREGIRFADLSSYAQRLARPAIKAAARREDFRYTVTAALWWRGKLVATARNGRLAYSGRETGRRCSVCAEARVLAKIPRGARGSDLTLVVTRTGKGGALLNARPCARCERLIHRAGIRLILHT